MRKPEFIGSGPFSIRKKIIKWNLHCSFNGPDEKRIKSVAFFKGTGKLYLLGLCKESIIVDDIRFKADHTRRPILVGNLRHCMRLSRPEGLHVVGNAGKCYGDYSKTSRATNTRSIRRVNVFIVLSDNYPYMRFPCLE
jgi:hypothetical protein